jgi:predicted permease
MKDRDTRIAGSSGMLSVSRAIVAAQVAVSVMLLLTSVMFVKTMRNLRAVDLGFSAGGVMTMSLDPLMTGDDDARAREQWWNDVLQRVRTRPGVRAASLSVLTPLSGRDTGKTISIPGFEPQSQEDRIVHLNHVSDDYFATFGIAIAAGRALTSRDRRDAANAVVLNETAAMAYFPGRSAIGEHITLGKGQIFQVVGVARDYKHVSVRRDAPRFAFISLGQRLDPISRITLAVKSDQPAAAVTQSVAHEVHAVFPHTLISDVISVNEQVDATLVSERLLSTLATAFAAVALALVAIGLYGVLSYAVARRRTEFGVRLALGERPAHLASVVVLALAPHVALGIAIGLPIALAIARMAERLLFGVGAADPSNYAVSVIAVVLVATMAAVLPARRAAKTDPMTALRCD